MMWKAASTSASRRRGGWRSSPNAGPGQAWSASPGQAPSTGDLFIVGAKCEARLPGYCAALGIPERGEDFTAALKAKLAMLAATVDAGFPANIEFSVEADGTPHLKQLASAEQPVGLTEFEGEIQVRLQERHLLDILGRAEHWSRYTRHFGPPSGSVPKLAQAIQRCLFTVFGYGCNLGPGQTARHAPEVATAQALRRINAQHVTGAKLEAAMVDVIDQYARFAPPSPTAPTSRCARTTCSAQGTSATAAMAASPTTTSPTTTSRCSPASFPAAYGKPSTSSTAC